MPTSRRDLVLGAACVAAAGAALALRPRRKLVLLGKTNLDAAVPQSFGDWTSHPDPDLVRPDLDKKSLASRLYNQTVSRIYTNARTGSEVMLLIAYGENQSDLLQLHRPESCYPAVGFRLLLSRKAEIPLRNGVLLPGRRVVASRSDHNENIVYWTRLGEYLPVDAGDQRRARLETAMQGYVADGALFRFSMVGNDDAPAFQQLNTFIAGMLGAAPPATLPAFVGTKLAKAVRA